MFLAITTTTLYTNSSNLKIANIAIYKLKQKFQKLKACLKFSTRFFASAGVQDAHIDSISQAINGSCSKTPNSNKIFYIFLHMLSLANNLITTTS